jgi:pimeloyl-ACP methyl ester carboxylesterase
MPFKTPGPVRLSFDRAGDNGTPVLLVMGFGMPGRAWMSQVPSLAEHHRVVWFDNRGVGESDAPGGLYTMREMAGDVIALLDHLEWDSAHVVGASMGGMIAQEVALRHRARVRSMALIATHAGGLKALWPTRRGLGLFLRANSGNGQARIDTLSKLLYTDAFRMSPEIEQLHAEMLANLATPAAARGRIAQFAAVARHRTASRLGRLADLRTLIIRPEQDLLIRPSESERLKRFMPHADLRSIPNAGHGLIRECADTVNAALLEHFREADRALTPKPAGRGDEAPIRHPVEGGRDTVDSDQGQAMT